MDYSSYDKIEEGYYDKAMSEGNIIQRVWHKNRFNEIRKQFSKKGTVLDLGCGPGSLLAFLSPVIEKGVGVDIAKKQIHFASKKFEDNQKLKWICSNALNLNPHEKFDYIIIGEFIEHISFTDSVYLLRKVKELLKNTGRCIITTPNYNSLWPIIEILLSKIGPIDYTKQHINKLNLKKIQNLMKKEGFYIHTKYTFNVISPFLSIFSVSLAKLVYPIENKLFPFGGSEILINAGIKNE